MSVSGESDSRRKQYLADAAFFYWAVTQPEACCNQTPVKSAFDKWKAAREAAEAATGIACDALSASALALADDVVNTPSHESRDLIYKMMAYTFFGEHAPCDGPLGESIYAEAREWVGVAA